MEPTIGANSLPDGHCHDVVHGNTTCDRNPTAHRNRFGHPDDDPGSHLNGNGDLDEHGHANAGANRYAKSNADSVSDKHGHGHTDSDRHS